ncbi:MAG: hypothetical protein N2049_06860, partial [Anaerolineales bacterium]|nr:hypothetical protein [Anaerolineales bacterium]
MKPLVGRSIFMSDIADHMDQFMLPKKIHEQMPIQNGQIQPLEQPCLLEYPGGAISGCQESREGEYRRGKQDGVDDPQPCLLYTS